MSFAKTNIEWTDRTWNPTRGCSRVSAGCDNCYAIREANRHAGTHVTKYRGGGTERAPGGYAGLVTRRKDRIDWSGVVRLVPEKLEEPLHWRIPQRVFVDSMSDLFHPGLSDDQIDQVFAIMALSAQHTFQVLTKRPERMLDYFSAPMLAMRWAEIASGIIGPNEALRRNPGPLPLKNVWLGVSVEDQATADERIPRLLETPAALRFVSYEPALGPVDFGAFAPFYWTPIEPSVQAHLREVYPNGLPDNSLNAIVSRMKVDWVIVGGESGPKARTFGLRWARAVVQQCRAADVPVFVKQLGAKPFSPEDGIGDISIDPTSDKCRVLRRGERAHDVRRLTDVKGGDMSEWPEDLRVREFPK